MIAADDRDALVRWCARHLSRTVECRYRPAGTRGVVLSEDTITEETASTLIETCTRDARGRPSGRLRYEFRILDLATGRVRDTWSISWHQQASGDEEQDETSHLDGSALGQVRQAQRFSEALFRMTIGSLATVLQTQQAAITDLTDKLVSMEREKRELLVADDARRDRQHERDAAIVRQAGEDQRRMAIWDSIRLWVPVALARLNDGKGVLPETPSANELVMYELLRSMSEEQLGQLMLRLDDRQRAAVMTLIRAAQPVVERSNTNGTPVAGEAAE